MFVQCQIVSIENMHTNDTVQADQGVFRNTHTHIYICIYVYINMHAIAIDEKGHEFEREQGEVYGRV